MKRLIIILMLTILLAVTADNSNMKTLSVAYPSLQFNEAKWQEAISSAVNEREEFIKYMNDNRAEIKKQRTVYMINTNQLLKDIT